MYNNSVFQPERPSGVPWENIQFHPIGLKTLIIKIKLHFLFERRNTKDDKALFSLCLFDSYPRQMKMTIMLIKATELHVFCFCFVFFYFTHHIYTLI